MNTTHTYPPGMQASSKTPPHAVAAAAACRCPRCRKGALYTHPVYSTKYLAMHEHCPVCGLKYEVETGFFWGAMYFSYAITVGFFLIGLFIFMYTSFDGGPLKLSDNISFLAIYMPSMFLILPINMRYSRVLMLYLFGGETTRFDPTFWQKKP